MKSVVLLHPFSAQAIGLEESDLYYYHSKPHENAFRVLQESGYQTSIDYFTGRLIPYQKEISGLVKKFWPVTKPLFKDRHKWRKQESKFHFRSYNNKVPDLTIINMSGHGSSYSFKLAQLITKHGKAYITMIGGIHMSDHDEAMTYFKNAHHLIVHTNYQREQLKSHPKFKDLDIRVIPLGVNTDVFKPNDKTEDEVRLLFVGRLSRLKQIEKAIEVLHNLQDTLDLNVKLDIIGPFSDEGYHQELMALVERLKLKDNVTFIGPLNQNELIPYYQKASLLLLPSQHESFGMVMIEAMSCGTPVAAFKNSGGPDEIIIDGVNGLLCNDANFSTRVKDLLMDQSLLEQLSSNSRTSVVKRWSLNYTIACFQASVESALNTNDSNLK